LFWFFFVWLGRFSRARVTDQHGDLRFHGEELALAAWSPGVAALLRGVQSAPPATRTPLPDASGG
jgi:hypothetical protein